LIASWGATENAADFNYVSPTFGQTLLMSLFWNCMQIGNVSLLHLPKVFVARICLLTDLKLPKRDTSFLKAGPVALGAEILSNL